MLIEKTLQHHGYWTIPTYDYRSTNKKSPRLMKNGKYYVLPDLDVSNSFLRIWIECKHKLGADFTCKSQKYEHGFPKKHYKHYLEVEKLTKNNVWVFFFELSQQQKDINFNNNPKRYCMIPKISTQPNRVLRGSLLRKLTIRNAIMQGEPHVYFPQDEFFIIGTLDNKGILKPVTINGNRSLPFPLLFNMQ